MTAASPQDPPPHLPVRADWLALSNEDIIEPELPIVDPHHHLWEQREPRYLFHDLLADISTGHNIVATVFMECRAMYRADGDPALAPVGEVEFVNGIAAMSASGNYGPARICAGIVGTADLQRGADAARVLEAEIAAGDDRFRGIRTSSASHPDPSARGASRNASPGLLGESAFRQGFACLKPLGLSFDAWMYHTQLDELVDLARAFPDTAIVLNHVGAPLGIGPYAGKRDEVFAAWKGSIQALSALPNISVKLGGLGMRLFGFDFQDKPRPPSSADLAAGWRPYIETCIDAFGTPRCMFESNFPVDKGTCGYVTLWNAFKRIAQGAGEDEKRDLFRATAIRVYRLPVTI